MPSSTIEYLFLLFAGVAVIAGLLILFARNVLYAALSLLIVFLGVSAVFVLGGAGFLAITQIVVYVTHDEASW